MSCVHPSCACPALSWVTKRLYRAWQSALATRAMSVSCHDTMNFVATWDLLTMTELCRDLKFSCRDLVSTAYTSLCRDTEKSCCDINLLTASALYRDTEKLYRDMGFSFIPVLYHDLRAYVAAEKSPRHDNLCRGMESPVATLNLLNLGNTLL